MYKNIRVLIISDDDNSEIVHFFLKQKITPMVRKTILSALEVLRHLEVAAIIIDHKNKSVDAIELILNARDITQNVPIFTPDRLVKPNNWYKIQNFKKIIKFKNNNDLPKQIFKNIN